MDDYYDSSYDIQCPSCKTTKFRNPQMKLMVNVCGHAICDTCVKLLFMKESGQCPECDITLKRSKFRAQIFEDPLVEKEIDIRRKVMKIFTKQEDDFETLEEWNMYLEEIEEIVYHITNNINRQEYEKRLENYEKMCRDEIRRNVSKRSKEYEEIDRIYEEEKLMKLERVRLMQEEEEKARMVKLKVQNNLLQDLMSLEGNASEIVQTHTKRLRLEQEKQEEELLQKCISQRNRMAREFSSGVKIGYSRATNMEKEEVEQKSYEYVPPMFPPCLEVPQLEDLEEKGYLNHIRKAMAQANAGGYTEHYGCLRALQEFMWGHVLTLSSSATSV